MYLGGEIGIVESFLGCETHNAMFTQDFVFCDQKENLLHIRRISFQFESLNYNFSPMEAELSLDVSVLVPSSISRGGSQH